MHFLHYPHYMAKFNSYIEHPEIERWRELCVNEGELYRYSKGEEFVSIGRVARYIGYVKSGGKTVTACGRIAKG